MKMEEYIRGIPSGLLTAQLGEREIQVVGISENGFEFRLEKKAARQLLTDAVPAQHQVLRDAAPPQHCIVTPFCKVCFYDLEQALWQELVLTEYGLEKAPALSQQGHREKLCAASFYQLYRVCVTSPEFRIAVQKLLLQYTRYIHLKLEEDDDEKSSRRTGTLFGWLAQSVVSAASRRRAHRAMRDAPVEDETDAASIVSDLWLRHHP